MLRRRFIKEIGTILGVVVILGVLVFGNSQVNRGGLREKKEGERMSAEAVQKKAGLNLLHWDTLQKTQGTIKTGPIFDDQVKSLANQQVNIVGFMSPIDEFKDATYFMLLPVPIGCFFCDAPPMRDVMLVEMEKGRTAMMVEEPVVVSGTLVLNEKPGSKFFYGIKNANWGAADKEGTLTRKEVGIEHQGHISGEGLGSETEQLFDAQGAPPSAPGGNVTPPPPAGQ